jgi:N-acetylglucosamine kinase-like BadF-type ATPase
MAVCVIGIDAGGTSVRVRVVDEHGMLLRESRCEATPEGGPEVLEDLLKDLLSDVESPISIVAGITKVSRAGVVSRWEAFLSARFPSAHIQILPDYAIALWGSLPIGERSGVVVVAGTGSVIYGEDKQGASVRVGGRGWEYGDEGSGAHLTNEMIRRTLHALDGLQAMTPLSDALCHFLNTNDPALLGERARQRALEDGRGFLLPLILAQAQAGDREAINLFVGAGGWLATYTKACIARLVPETHPDACEMSIVSVGGMWHASTLLTEPFERVLRRTYPNVHLISTPGDSLQGAIRVALDAIK